MVSKTNKMKFIAEMMLLVLLVTSAFSFAGCADKESVDLSRRFNIDDGTISFLCMRSIPNVFSEYGARTQSWGEGLYDEKLYVVEGDETYSRPRISYSITVLSSELGDGRTFFEKYVNKYINTHGSYEYSMKIHGVFYAFQGEVGELNYKFDKYNSKGEKIKIYNNDELIAEVSVITKLKKSEDFYRELLEKTLFVIKVDKYSEIEGSVVTPINNLVLGEPNLDVAQLSYLSIRDIRNYDDVIELTTYKNVFSGGYSGIYWDRSYHEAVNKISLEFTSISLASNINIDAEFYEYMSSMGKIYYSFVQDNEKGNCVELYSNSYLVGKVFYSSDSEIPQEWLTEFLNENLVVMNVKK